jgi:hypothetical protein
MTRLKLSDLANEKPVRVSVDLSAKLHRELVAYGVALNDGDAKGAPPPERLIAPMIARFIATDRSFAKSRKGAQAG